MSAAAAAVQRETKADRPTAEAYELFKKPVELCTCLLYVHVVFHMCNTFLDSLDVTQKVKLQLCRIFESGHRVSNLT